MFRTVKLKIERTNDLVQTVKIYNLACQFILDFGTKNKEYNKNKLHNGTYKEIRSKYSQLPSGLVQTARDMSSDMLKRDKFKHTIIKKPLSSIRYDCRTMKVFLESGYCKLTTIFGRQEYKFKLADYYEKYKNWKVQNAQLIVNQRCCYLNVQVEGEDVEFNKGDRRLGIDLGINNIAVCSDNTFYNSKKLKNTKGKYQHLKAELQNKGTRSAFRKLKKIAGRERRFVRDMNHCLANKIVDKLYDIFVFEDLTGIRNGDKGRKFNKKLGNWSNLQLFTFVSYKAENKGKLAVQINPKYTSQTCSKCGYKHKNNRHGNKFECLNCGFKLNADLNASRNIGTFSMSLGVRVSVNHPIVATKLVTSLPF